MSTLMTDQKKLLTYPEAAEFLQIHVVSLRRLVSEGRLEHIKIGKSVRFTLEQLVDANHVPATRSHVILSDGRWPKKTD